MEQETAVAKDNKSIVPASIIVAGLIIAGALLYDGSASVLSTRPSLGGSGAPFSSELITPRAGVVLAATWGDMGQQLVSTGVIDANKFKTLYMERGEFTKENEELLLGNSSGKIKITNENAGYLLNLFWALGLSSKNIILEEGEMVDPRYGGAHNFASTGGWSLAVGHPMGHYSAHSFFDLTEEEQGRVARVAKGIYRPCCNNSTHFADCNHGMAMLGLFQLMASQGVSEADMFKNALIVNSYWYPETYETIATYLHNRGVDWKEVDPKEVLGAKFSSGSGYAQIVSELEPKIRSGGGGCSV
jgi:hypothetical protein